MLQKLPVIRPKAEAAVVVFLEQKLNSGSRSQEHPRKWSRSNHGHGVVGRSRCRGGRRGGWRPERSGQGTGGRPHGRVVPGGRGTRRNRVAFCTETGAKTNKYYTERATRRDE